MGNLFAIALKDSKTKWGLAAWALLESLEEVGITPPGTATQVTGVLENLALLYAGVGARDAISKVGR